MADFFRVGDRLINLDRVEMIRLDQPRPQGRPGRCHEVCFRVSGFVADDRLVRFADDTPEGRALLAYVEGDEDAAPRPILPLVAEACVSLDGCEVAS